MVQSDSPARGGSNEPLEPPLDPPLVHRFISKCIGQFLKSTLTISRIFWEAVVAILLGGLDFYAMASVSVEQEVNDRKCV